MPKDKKSKEKEGSSCSKKVELVVKRKNSIVDSSSGSSYASSSSAAASDNSGNTSDNSADSDGFDNEKSTMTGESGQGTSSGTCTFDIRDRTEEMRRIMNENNIAERKQVRVINDQNAVPISDDTHMVPIFNGAEDKRDENSESPTSSTGSSAAKKANVPSTSASNKQGQNTKNQKQKQLTKKQRKELERQKAANAGEPIPQFPGQKERPRKIPLEHIMTDRPNLQLHQINDWSIDQENRNIIVRGLQKTRPLRDGQDPVAPVERSDKELGPEMTFTDLHRHSQSRYLRFSNTVAGYIGTPASLKPVHRMGHGVAACGITDPETRLLTINGSNQIVKHGFQDYAKSSMKMSNWRQEYIANTIMDQASHDSHFADLAKTLKNSVDSIINGCPDPFHKRVLLNLRDGNLRTLVLHFGEMDRQLVRHNRDVRNQSAEENLEDKSRKERFVFLKSEVFSLCTREFVERTHENQHINRSVSLLHYLSARCAEEPPCDEQGHRKCAMLHFLLSNAGCSDKKKQLTQQFYGGNTILHMAAMTGAPCQIDALLRQGAPLNMLNDHFRSPLSVALRRHCTLVARQLLWHGADLGGAITLTHILPKDPNEAKRKEMSEYLADNARVIPYKAREFMIQRHRLLNSTFHSWVEALLIESETRFALGVESCKSSLHQVRIGKSIDDKIVNVSANNHVKKTVRIAVERTSYPPASGTKAGPDGKISSPGQVVLFLLPCQYSAAESTMPACFPYIMRVPMLHDVEKVAAGGPEGCPPEEVANLKPIKLFSRAPMIEISDGTASRETILESFFSIEHNGLIYAYNLPNIVTHATSETSKNEHAHITVHLTIPEKEAEAFKDCFFMLQAVEVIYRSPPVQIPQGTMKDALKSTEPCTAAEKAMKIRDDHCRGIVADIQSVLEERKAAKMNPEREAEMMKAARDAVADCRANGTELVNGIERKITNGSSEPSTTASTSGGESATSSGNSNGSPSGTPGSNPASPSKMLSKTKTE